MRRVDHQHRLGLVVQVRHQAERIGGEVNGLEIAVEQPVGNDLVDGSATVDCGTVMVGNSGSPITFTIKNVGIDNLTSLSLSKSGANSGDFTLGTLGATTVAPGASTTFTVTFSPSAEGARTAALQIASNDSNENPFDITLTGTALTTYTMGSTADTWGRAVPAPSGSSFSKTFPPRSTRSARSQAIAPSS